MARTWHPKAIRSSGAKRGSGASNVRSLGSTVLRTARRRLLDRALSELPFEPSGRAVLVGTGHDPYKEVLSGCSFVVKSDLDAHPPETDLLMDAQAMSLRSDIAELVVAFEVLEHIVDPLAFIREAHRVLAPAGRLVLSTPLLYPIHGKAHDYWRFTPAGMHALLDSAGFSPTVLAHGNAASSILDIVGSALPGRPLRVVRLVSPLVLLCSRKASSSRSPSGLVAIGIKA